MDNPIEMDDLEVSTFLGNLHTIDMRRLYPHQPCDKHGTPELRSFHLNTVESINISKGSA